MSTHNRSKETVDGVFGAPRGLTAVGEAAEAWTKRREARMRLAGTSSVRFIPRALIKKQRRAK